jgi:Domain of unknown function (DUF4252)
MRTLNTKIWPRILMPRVLMTLAVACAPLAGFAQPGKLDLDNLEKLNAKAAVVNDVTLDKSLLDMAVKILDSTHDEDAAQVKDTVKGLKGIYIKSFEFDEPNQYSPADVEAIRSQLARPGWSRIVQSRDKRHGENNEVYLFKENDKVAGVAILVAEPKELTVVNIVGFIDVDKLGELSGKFGVPELKERPERPKAKTPAATKPDNKENLNDDDQDQNDDQQ